MSLNKVMLIGNVGNDPEVRYLESNPQNPAANVKVASFRLATTERYRDRNGEPRENTEWHSIVVWRNNADVVEKFVHKGSQIYIEGKLRTRQWTDQTGAKRYTTEVVADTLQLLGKRPEGEAPQQPAYQGGYPAAQPAAPAYAPAQPAAPVAAAQPQPAAPQQPVNPAYQGPLPAAEPSDDLPF
ncbi:MAG: single-stranded DNA-binding protein [Bacteroidales bacterium]|nr:single-stranded DNA-binding protein [Bacteroidales bacterium]